MLLVARKIQQLKPLMCCLHRLIFPRQNRPDMSAAILVLLADTNNVGQLVSKNQWTATCQWDFADKNFC